MEFITTAFHRILLLVTLTAAACLWPATSHAQENDRAELVYTERLSKQAPDSALLKTGRYQEAIVQTAKALSLAERTNDLYEKAAACRDLGKVYHLMHREDSAYRYLELSRLATVDIYSKENYRQTAISITIVVILLIILGWVIISRRRIKIRNDRLESENNRQVYEMNRERRQSELMTRALQEERLAEELDVRRKGLTTFTLHVIQKNQLLENLRDRLSFLVKEERLDQKKQLQQLIQQINQNFNHDQYWEEFRETFGQVHRQFFDNLNRHSCDLTGNDLRLLSLIKLNLASGDIATLLGISPDSLRVSRYRLKKKLSLGAEDSLTAFVQAM